MSSKHVIVSPEVGGPIYDRHCGGFLDDTHDTTVTARVLTDGARLLFSEVAALLAGVDPLSDRREYGGKPSDLFRRLLQ
jgi:hypothetical protein